MCLKKQNIIFGGFRMNIVGWILLLILILSGFFYSFIVGRRYQKQLMARLFVKNHYHEKVLSFKTMNPILIKEPIIFCGDSITEGFSLTEIFQRNDLINRGISGDTITGVINRLSLSCYDLYPKQVFYLIGINNLTNLKNSLETIENDYLSLKSRLDQYPAVPYNIISLLPTQHRLDPSLVRGGTLDRITAINLFLKQTFLDHYVDIYLSFTDEEGHLKTAFTKDGLHLNTDGYLHFKEILNPYIK